MVRTPSGSLSKFIALAAVSAGMVVLSGCSGFQGVVIPDAGVNSSASQPGAISGNVYGGHAPLVGAHVYLVQPGTTGYGSQVTSLLTSTGYNANFPLMTFSGDQFVPSGFKSVLTDSTGAFYITGDYTCTANQPVILIAYGGSPSYAGSGPNTFTVTNASETNNGTTGFVFTYTIGSPLPELFYPGEPVTVSGATGGNLGFNNSGNVIGDMTLTTTQFSIFVPYNTNPNLGNGTPSGFVSGNLGQIATGTPAFNPAAVNMAVLGNCPSPQPLTAVTIAGTASPYTVTVTGANTLSPGNAVTFAGLTGAAAALNGTVGRVASANLSTTKFTATVTTGTTQAAGSYNSTTGTFFAGFNNLSYVYVNEISTTAAAYAFAGFTNTAATAQTGYDEFHIGSPGTTQSLASMANNAVTAGNIYDIQGSNTAAGNPDGEVHIARTTTQSGTGTLNTALIDTIGNILAACVDSANTVQLATSANVTQQSPQCATLGQYAEDNGFVDLSSTPVVTHRAANISQAAFNLARFPQGSGTITSGTQTLGNATTATSFISNLVGLIGGNAPFTPYLANNASATSTGSAGNGGTPNDFVVTITFNIGTQVSDVEIDGVGNAWAAAGAQGMYSISPAGLLTNYTAPGGFSTALSTNLAIDGVSGNVWAPGVASIYQFTPGNTTATTVGATNSTEGGSIALDPALNQYIPSGNDGIVASAIVKQSSTGTLPGGNFPVNGNAAAAANTAGWCANAAGYVALDSGGNLWTATSNNFFQQSAGVCRFDSNGNLVYSTTLPQGVSGQAGGFAFPRGLVTDAGDNAFYSDKNLDALYRVAQGTTTANTGTTTITLHQRLSAPKNLAIDGANTVWVANSGDLNATTGAKYSTGLMQFTSSLVPITSNYITGDPYSTTPTKSLTSVAIDPSGNVWAAQGVAQGSSAAATNVYEFIGLAVPTITPIALAKATNGVGAKPGLYSAKVIAYSLANNVLSLGISSTPAFHVGETLILSDFVGSTYLDGHTILITQVTNSTNIQATFTDGFTHADIATQNQAGVASAFN